MAYVHCIHWEWSGAVNMLRLQLAREAQLSSGLNSRFQVNWPTQSTEIASYTIAMMLLQDVHL